MSASHSDSPSFHVKVNAEMVNADGYVRINTEKYGGCHMAPWMDRPLTVSGRLLVETETGIETKLVYVDKDLMMIPNVAIHMNRNINDGYKYDPKCDSIPMFGLSEAKGGFMKAVAEAAGVTEEQILGHDLFLNIRQKGFQWGVNNEFISSAALDDLQCAFASLRALSDSACGQAVALAYAADNEEVGSGTKQGADSTFLEDVLERIEEFRRTREFRLDLGVGIQNSIDRLNILYGEEASLEISRIEPQGTRIDIMIPIKRRENGVDERDFG